MRQEAKLFIFTILFVLVSACTRQVQEKELLDIFVENQSKFEELSNLSCSLLNHDFKSLYYEVGDYSDREQKAKSADSDKDYKFKWSAFNKYGEEFENDMQKIDDLLADLDLDGILIRTLSEKCRLYIDVWSIWMTGEGQEMTYLYNPETIYEYSPNIHAKPNRDLKTQIDFTMPLSSGWFVGYSNTP
ncbi:hypothetical protein [Shewanella nanhaiensis]|uniref:Uncharacterized protein n=1 Tax=Shewanella nanhaiensis TaxID=2864872 RepID=A0ABS7E0H1_9GAMM|nr:hypothetical protein [Shewanella nanhaiensis]MBW8183040.1 hypothetical protein [Shewanella nanhaiensis]